LNFVGFFLKLCQNSLAYEADSGNAAKLDKGYIELHYVLPSYEYFKRINECHDICHLAPCFRFTSDLKSKSKLEHLIEHLTNSKKTNVDTVGWSVFLSFYRAAWNADAV